LAQEGAVTDHGVRGKGLRAPQPDPGGFARPIYQQSYDLSRIIIK